jgi:D-3-phosphoglycerate dehydrogenase
VGDPVVETLILDLLKWLAAGERTYEDVMEAWRTSCPKLPVWEEANDRGLITSEGVNGRKLIMPSPSGFVFLEKYRLRSELRT